MVGKKYYLALVSTLLLTISQPSFAHLDGAAQESCYNHNITHELPFAGLAMLITCGSPCVFLLEVTGKVVDPSVAPNSFTYEPVNNMTNVTGADFEYECGATYRVVVKQNGLNGFQGFLVQARDNTSEFDANANIYGTWLENAGFLYKVLECRESVDSTSNYFNNSVTHRNSDDIQNQPMVSLYWEAPQPSQDPPVIQFWYSMVQQLSSNYAPAPGPVGIPARNCYPSPTPTPTPTPIPTPTPTPTPMPPPTTMVTNGTTTGTTTDEDVEDTTTTATGSQAARLSPEEIIGIGVGVGLGGFLIIVVLVLLVVIGCCCCNRGNKGSAKPSRVSMLWMNNPSDGLTEESTVVVPGEKKEMEKKEKE